MCFLCFFLVSTLKPACMFYVCCLIVNAMIRCQRDYIGSQIDSIHRKQDNLEDKVGCVLVLLQKMTKKFSNLCHRQHVRRKDYSDPQQASKLAIKSTSAIASRIRSGSALGCGSHSLHSSYSYPAASWIQIRLKIILC